MYVPDAQSHAYTSTHNRVRVPGTPIMISRVHDDIIINDVIMT